MIQWLVTVPRFPLICVITMVGGSVEAFCRGDWRYGAFWLLDAGITGWSSFMLRS